MLRLCISANAQVGVQSGGSRKRLALAPLHWTAGEGEGATWCPHPPASTNGAAASASRSGPPPGYAQTRAAVTIQRFIRRWVRPPRGWFARWVFFKYVECGARNVAKQLCHRLVLDSTSRKAPAYLCCMNGALHILESQWFLQIRAGVELLSWARMGTVRAEFMCVYKRNWGCL